MSGCSNFYGNIANVETTGASERTAKPEGLSYAGVAASEKIAERDLKNMDKYKETITKLANSKCIPPSLVAAVISRESHAGTALKDGWGDHGNAFGLMQVDKRYHKPHGAWNSEEHIKQGTDILCQSITDIQKKFPTWSKEQQLKGNMVHSWAPITAAVIIMVGPFISNYDTNISDDINITKGSNTTTEDVRFAKRQRSPSLDVNHNFLTMLKRKWNTSVMETAENGGISAYNAGTRNVWTYEGMDVGTTHDDYANDVVARAKFFQRNGY